MLKRYSIYLILSAFLLTSMSCKEIPPTAKTPARPATHIVKLEPGPDIQEQLLSALIKAKTGTVIQLAEGKYDFTGSLSLTQAGVTLEGAGMDKTILSFAKQDQGKEGLLVTVGDFTIQNLTIEDSKSDALKVVGGNNVIFKQVRTRWTGGPKPTNGGYGIYPVQCQNVLVENCEAECASDAGIYVGQSRNVIVRGCKASRNVAGIEVENSISVDVHDNTATNNTGGILVFDLPNLPAKNGHAVRVFKNKVTGNNHKNFAPEGNIVATVPPGTGMMILATDQVECFDNEVKDNQTTGLAIISFHLTEKPINDKDYDPYPEGVYVHDNLFASNGTNPSGTLGMGLGAILGKPMPDILYDGNLDTKKLVDGKMPEKLALRLDNNGKATFANINYKGGNVLSFALSKPKIERTTTAYEGKQPNLPVVELGAGQR
jgi:parallel beta-helix repeat protein